jgi:mono/diheme cytochrome c family protein
MKSASKYLVMGISVLFGLILLAFLALNLMAQARLNKQYKISVDPIFIPEDEDSRLRGEHLVRAVSACMGCHGEDLGGQILIDTPILGQVSAPNLTSGTGGAASRLSSEDWVRVLRHGIDQTGRPLLIMPAQHFRHYSDADLGAIIAYIQSVPPVDRETRPRHLSVFGRVLVSLGALDGKIPAEFIDHSAAPPEPLSEGITPEYGEFLVTVGTCKDCHGENLAGGRAGPEDPFAPNLTPGGELVAWTDQDFLNLIRTGTHPSGRKLNPAMPWQSFRYMTDTELGAIWVYLKGLPALRTNEE